MQPLFLYIALVTVALGWTSSFAADDLATLQRQITNYLESKHTEGQIIGAQLVVGSLRAPPSKSIQIGQIEPGDSRPVTARTLFGIGSCSKPVASAVVFTIIDDGKLTLRQPIDKYLPAFRTPTTSKDMPNRVTKQIPTRSPTVGELLTHRAGIYSQKTKLTPVQTRAIRDFRLTLDESVDLIARQPLLTPPGEAYAYSGAGYCVLGSVAEKATGKKFETLLQEKLCQPLGMRATTYFPDPKRFTEVACGGSSGPGAAKRPSEVAPHKQGDQLRLPLIGGSLYTTAEDMQRFSRMMLAEGRWGPTKVLSPEAWKKTVSQPYAGQTYGYGWTLSREGDKTVGLSHSGSLASYQALIQLDLPSQRYVIVFWTLADTGNEANASRLRADLARFAKGPAKPKS